MVGPTVQEDLFSILIRFRPHKVALSGDIAKMYRQIALDSCAKDFHRFLWRDSPEEPIKQYRMTRVIYGTASSAFHSTRSLVEVANRCPDESLENSIKQDFYVDDYLKRIKRRIKNIKRLISVFRTKKGLFLLFLILARSEEGILFLLFFFNPHIKIVLKSSTKFFVAKLKHLA